MVGLLQRLRSVVPNRGPACLRLAELLAISAKGKKSAHLFVRHRISTVVTATEICPVVGQPFEICNFCGEREMRNSVGLGPEP